MTATYAITESEDTRNLPMCKEIAEYLNGAYPGHTWYVRIDGGMLIIKDYKIHRDWSMTRKFSDVAHDAKKRKHDVVMAAGEFLECANMRRGAFDGEYAQSLEGRLDANDFTPIVPHETKLVIEHE